MTVRQKRELLILVAIVAVAIVAGSFVRTCSTAETPSVSRPSMSPRVVATVNNIEVWSSDVDKYSRATIGAMEMNGEEIPNKMREEVRRAALSQITEEILLVEGAKARGVSATEEEVTTFINSEFRSEFDSEEEFLKSLEADVGLSLDDLRKMVRSWIIREEMLELLAPDIEIADEEINTELKMYEEMLEGHPGGKVPPPAREKVVANLKRQKAETEYELWMDTLIASAEIEILDPELQAPEPMEETASSAPKEPGYQYHAERPDADGQPDDTEK